MPGRVLHSVNATALRLIVQELLLPLETLEGPEVYDWCSHRGIQRLRMAGLHKFCVCMAFNSTMLPGGMKLQNFLRTFEIAGSAYFLAFPTIFILVQDRLTYTNWQPILCRRAACFLVYIAGKQSM